jgi:DNA-binding GntR family transcriptional regulator
MIEQLIPPRPYLRNEVYAALKSRLGEMATYLTEPVHIREEELARSLGVSRTPVREALRRLEQEGLVTFRPRRGAQLMPASLDEYLEWLSIREVLEGLAAREVARNGAAIAPRLRDIFAGFDERAVVGRAEDYARANADFHAMIIEQSGNSLLGKAWQSFGHIKMVGLRVIERLNRGAQSLREHHDIIAAIAAGDADRAEATARAHIRAVRERAASLTKL